MNQNAKIDKLVLEYLEKRGLSATTKQLKAESHILGHQMSLAQSRGSTGVVQDLLFYLSADGNPLLYAKSFENLASWVDNSLDMYRYELSHVLYPVFIHCCLRLVRNQAANEATQLISRHSERFSKVGGQPSKVRVQEINELQAVTMPEHLTTNRIAQAVMKTKFPVTLCVYSFQLLMHFLEGSKLHLLLSIVNDNLAIQVEEGLPKNISDAAEKETSLLSGELGAGTGDDKLSDLNLNLLQGSAEDKHAAARLEEQEAAALDVDDDGKPLTKKEKAARQRTATGRREALAEEVAARMEPEIPLPSLAASVVEGQVADIKARVDVSSDALPSACFFTFVNTHHSLNCTTFNESGSLVAGGFADASVRVYDVQKAAGARKGGPGDEPGDEVTEFRGHSGAVYGVDFSYDNQLLVSASGDGTIRLWHLPLKACLNAYTGHMYPVWDVAASPRGHYFASAGADRTARFWSVERNRPLRILAGHYTDVDVVRWHPNAHYLATGASDHTVRLWDVREGQCQRVLVGHRAVVTAIAFHPRGATMSSADEDGTVITWDLATSKRLATAEKHKGPIWSLAYSQGGGKLLASGGNDDYLRLWDATNASELSLLKSFRTKGTPVFCVQFSPRNLLLGSGALTLPKRTKS